MRVLIIDNGTKYLRRLKDLFGADETSITPWKKISASIAKSADLIILSGAPKYSIVNYPLHWQKETIFIQQIKKPVIGICMGFELIAHAYGASLQRMKKKEKGILTIRSSGPILGKKKFRVYENHRAPF